MISLSEFIASGRSVPVVAAGRRRANDDAPDLDDEDDFPVDDDGDEDETEEAKDVREARRRARELRKEAEEEAKSQRIADLESRHTTLTHMAKIRSVMRSRKCSRIQAATIVARETPEAHREFLAATNRSVLPSLAKAIRRRGKVLAKIRRTQNRNRTCP